MVLAVLAALGLALLVRGGEERARLGGARPATAGDARASAAAATLDALGRAVLSGSPGELRALAAPGDRLAVRELDQLAAAVGRLGLARLELRYVADSARRLGEAQQERLGADAFVVDAELTWQVARVDPTASRVEVPLVMRPADEGPADDPDDPDDSGDSGGAAFVTARALVSERAPVWFNSRVSVSRPAPDLRVVAAWPQRAASLDATVLEGVRTVRAALPAWTGEAVVEAPATGLRFARASGLAPASARGIAAVTTSPDGTDASDPTTSSGGTSAGAGLERVYLNPTVYGPLGPPGQQIVMSHELTHVAVGVATAGVPLWLSEGYADWVALRSTEEPTDVLAAQILRLVREDGPPTRLPGREELDGATPDVGAWYESAWLAARSLADRYGEDRLHAFYRQVERDGGTDAAYARLGTTEAAFTRAWADELQRLAG